MKLDDEQQRDALLQIINQVNFSGASVEYIADLKRRIAEAEIEQSEGQSE